MSRVSTCHHGYWCSLYCLYSVNRRVEHVLIYKRGHYYGFLDNENCISVDQKVADLSRRGFTVGEGAKLVTLTNRLFHDK